MDSNTPLLVGDASSDPRFQAAEEVAHDPFLRFYMGVPLHHPNGTVIGTLAVTDITPRKVNDTDSDTLHDFGSVVDDTIATLIKQNTSQQTLDLYISLTQNFPFGLIVGAYDNTADMQSLRVVAVNTAMCRALGLEQSAFVNKRIGQVLPNIRKTSILQAGLDAIETGKVQHLNEFRYADHQVSPLQLVGTITPLPDRRICIALENITTRREDERYLAELVAMLHATIEATGSGIVAITDDHIGLVNRKYLQLWNVPEDAPWRSDREQLAVHALDQVKDAVWLLERFQVIHDHPEDDSYDEVEMSDGRILERISHPQRVNERTIGRVWAFRDITERKHVEQQIHYQLEAIWQQNTELEIARRQANDATRLKSEFMATMSHELRTPLNAIIGYTDIMLQEIDGTVTKVHREYLNRMMINAEHLLTLINDVLDIARIEAGRVELQRRALHPQALMNSVIMQMSSLALQKGLMLEYNIASRMPAMILGDSNRYHQILINLVGNAIKFTESGYVHIAFDIEFDPHEPQFWTMAVRDSGVGIPEGMHDFIFDEFQQVDMTTARRAGGTGLGLAIVRKLVTLAGGRITLDSEVGRGSTFTVYLPL